MIDVGQSVGNYNITAKLGEGGMGMVYLAEHPVIGRKVALKAIHPQFARNAEVVSRFVNEAKSVNQIGHDHIVDVTDFGTTPAGDFYFIMEYLAGESLSDWIKVEGRFQPERARHIVAQIADALNASHEHGVIHRDLKPENIYLIERGEVRDFVKVLDFGLAKLTHVADANVPMHNTRTGSVMGTPYYMAPEQCEGKEIDHRADIYSLGVIFFEMLTGKLPFGGDAYGEIIVKHVTMQPPAARSVVPDLPASLDMILFRALAKDPNQRFQTMAEFREALLDPERYASSMPALGVAEDLSGRVRAATPMARTEMDLRPLSRRSGRIGSGGPSTFRDSAGEIDLDAADGHKVRNRHGRVVLLLGAAAAVALGVVGLTRQGPPFLSAATLRKRPAVVHVSFNSEPDGATVSRVDGTVLGVTPLVAQLPYGDAPMDCIIGKAGYLPKAVSIVPNLPSRLFASLQAVSAPAHAEEPSMAAALPPSLYASGPLNAESPTGEGPAGDPPALEAPRPRKAAASRPARHRSSAPAAAVRPSVPEPDTDGVLEPTFR